MMTNEMKREIIKNAIAQLKHCLKWESCSETLSEDDVRDTIFELESLLQEI